ncbi:putative methyltransferase [Murinocardiopsis flavida]|uniref:Putative methyltransferase n=1 Tax=Murinocardiopsis flavida TaxID=645275 RepID=A0A2P8DDV0_9ACTN|nr:class I SAM-dependent methyltransferase family protein [Murinocardiopsis flavida]PSK95403.1 putative methyltransferase [Murinocardiopsis flavida]
MNHATAITAAPLQTTATATAGPVTKAKWALTRLALRTIGTLSDGVRIGYRHGFDSGTMLDYVYRNEPGGRWGVGRLIDRVYLNAVGWRAIRARRALLTDVLRTEIERREDVVRILDVAAGPGRYLQDLAADQPHRARILCRDLADHGLRRGAAQAAERGLDNIRYEQGDAFDPAPAPFLDGPPDVIVVSGLYELILSEHRIQASMRRLRALLAPGGVLVFTTQEHHPQLDFIANVLPNRDGDPWVMECRPARTTEQWARDAGFTGTASTREEVGLFAVTRAEG